MMAWLLLGVASTMTILQLSPARTRPTVEHLTMPDERRFKILLVEDDAQIFRVLELELEHEGYVVETARDGLRGLDTRSRSPTW